MEDELDETSTLVEPVIVPVESSLFVVLESSFVVILVDESWLVSGS